MATQVALAIKIESQGGEKVLKNLQDLETELSALQSDLKTLDFGTAEFDAAVKSINKIKSAIKDVDKATEGLETAQRVQAISEAISIVVASFQLLSGVIGIFITESEDLEAVQRFEAKAVAILNAALGLQTILFQRAELAAKGYTLSQLASDAANKLLTLSTRAATIAQTAFNAALRANPLALVTAGIVALGAAIFGLVKIYDSFFSASAKAKNILEEENRIEQELIKTRLDASKQLEAQLTILTDNVETRALELKTIDDLRKSYAGFNAFIDENNKLTEEGIAFLQLQIQLRQQEAALITISQKRTEKQIEFETKAAELRAEYGVSAKIQIEELRESYEDDFAAINNLQNEYTKSVNSSLQALEPYNKKLKQKAEIESKEAKNLGNIETAEEKRRKAFEKRLSLEQKQIETIQKRLALLDLVNNSLAQQITAELNFTTDVLNVENEVIEKQNELLGLRKEALGGNANILEELNKLFFQNIPEEGTIVGGFTDLLKVFQAIKEEFFEGRVEFGKILSFDELLLLAEKTFPGISEKLADIPFEAQKQFTEFFNSLDDRAANFRKTLDDANLLFFTEGDQNALQILLNLETELRNIRIKGLKDGAAEIDILKLQRAEVIETLKLANDEQNILDNIARVEENIRISIRNANKLREAAATNQKNGYVEYAKQQTQQAENEEQLAKTYEGQAESYKNQLATLKQIVDTIILQSKNSGDFIDQLIIVERQSEKNLKVINKNKEALEKAFDPQQLTEYFAGLGDALDVVFPTLIIDLQSYLERFGVEGTEAIIKGVVQGLKEQGKLTRKEAENIVNVLEKAGLALKTQFGFPFDPFAEQIKMLKGLLKSLPEDLSPLQKEFSKLRDFTEDYFNILNDLSGRLSNVIAQNNANLLDQLNYEQELALSKIGEANAATQRENDRINAERLAVEKDFAKQRFELEKKARVQELQFALATAIADGAQAIINTLASIPPPLGVIAATGIGVLTGAQVQVINNQLTTARSKTFIGRRGGLIAGSDHESGGVPALLEGGEFIVNREAVARFGNTISDLNSATGGRKLAIDDSRLVQAIATQNMSSPPLKAYVVYNSITDTEKLNKKITQLARL
jgi:hypothetical protein